MGKYINKWHTLAASIIIQYTAGLGYTFSIYSDQLKDHFGYTQEEIQGLGSANNLGGYLSILSGLVYDYTAHHHRSGPIMCLILAAILNFAGYSALWSAAKGWIHPTYWQVVGISIVAPLAGTFMDTSVLITCTRNFPAERGTVIGIIKACIGLSASVFTSTYLAFFQKDVLAYLLFLAVAPSAINLLLAFFINHVPFEQSTETPATTGRRLGYGIVLVGCLGLYLLATALIDGLLHPGQEIRLVMVLGTFVLVAATMLLPWGTGGLWAQPAHSNADSTASAGLLEHLEEPFLLSNSALKAPSEDACEDVATRGPFLLHALELGPGHCLISLDFWLLFFVCAIGMGTGLVYLNNLGQMVSALHGHSSAAVYVSIFSVSSCAGRLLLGHVPERALHARGLPRPLFLIGVSLLTAAVAVLCAFASLGALYPAALLAGLAFGGHWSLAPALACDFFGLRHFASNYCLLQLAPALGGFALATELAGYLYDRTAAPQGHHHNCRGHQCFRPAFLICAMLCLFAAAAATVLHLRMRSLYIAARRPHTV